MGVKGGRHVKLTSPPSVNRLSGKMWERRRLTTVWASAACYTDSFTFFTGRGKEKLAAQFAAPHTSQCDPNNTYIQYTSILSGSACVTIDGVWIGDSIY
jgi:hypothetical protein